MTTDYNIPTESIIFKEDPATYRLLVAFAHPDDESFGPAGTLIHYARQGVAVHYACGTRGEAGSVDAADMQGFETVAELRTQEMLNAAQILGLSGLHFLNYRDSGMENSADNENPACLYQAPLLNVTEKLVWLMRQYRPQVVLTFDPTGGYFHPDHIKMHQAATLAFFIANSAHYPKMDAAGLKPYQPQKLYYTAFPREWLRVMVRGAELLGKDPTAFGKNKDINLKRVAEVRQMTTTKIKVSPYYEASQAAADCHASQLSGVGILPEVLQKLLQRYDGYMRVMPPKADTKPFERDFFAGVA